MLLDPGSHFPEPLPERFRTLATDTWCAWWTGFAYYPGHRAGALSLQILLADLTPDTLPARTAELRGGYGLFLEHLPTRQRFGAIDPNGLFRLYASDRQLSTSYLELAQALALGPADLDPDRVVELLHYGQLFTRQTMTPRAIRRVRADEVITFDAATGQLVSRPRSVQTMESPPRVTFSEHWSALIEALRDERLSIDLTGGKDSRLIAALCREAGLEFELALSGHDQFWEFAIAREVAQALERPFVPTHPILGDLETRLPELLDLADGPHDVLVFHRLAQFQGARQARGITLVLNGAGGEIFNDHWWFQDYPFYEQRRSNLPRIYDLRIEHMRDFPHSDYFAGELRERSQAFRATMLQYCERFVRSRNTETYDQIAMEFKTREVGGRFTSSAAVRWCDFMVPFLDCDLEALGYHLPRQSRAFNRFHRRQITAAAPRAAKVRTTEYMSASDAPVDLLRDSFINVWNKTRRLTRKINQRLLNRRDFPALPDHPELRPTVRKLPLTTELLTRLKDHRLINPELQLTQIPDAHLGWFVTLGLLVARLEAGPPTPSGDHPPGHRHR